MIQIDNPVEKYKLVEKLFETTTNIIIEKDLFNIFTTKFNNFENKYLNKKTNIDNLNKNSLKIDINELLYRNSNDELSEYQEFSEIFMEQAELIQDLDKYIDEMCEFSKGIFLNILNTSENLMVNYVTNFYRSVIEIYFSKDKIMYPIYINMFYEYLKLEKTSKYDLLLSSVLGSGPILIKILQHTPKENIKNIKILDILNIVYDSLASICEDEYNILIQHFDIKHINKDYLSIASIGQVHEVLLNDEYNTQAIIKFIKPRSLLYLTFEVRILEKYYKYNIEKELNSKHYNCNYIEGINKRTYEYLKHTLYTLCKEFIFQNELENSIIMNKIYKNKTLSIDTIKIFKTCSKTIPYILMSKANGISLRKMLEPYKRINLKQNNNDIVSENYKIKDTKKLLSELISIWMFNMLLGDGYLHPDLHVGNLIVDVGLDKINKLTIIDFGNIGYLETEQQYYVLKLIDLHMNTVKNIQKYKNINYDNKFDFTKNYKNILNTFLEFSDIKINDSEKQKILESIIEFYKNSENFFFGELIKAIISDSPDLGKCSGGNLVEFAKGFLFLENTWKDIGNSKPIMDVFMGNLKYYPIQIIKLLYRKAIIYFYL